MAFIYSPKYSLNPKSSLWLSYTPPNTHQKSSYPSSWVLRLFGLPVSRRALLGGFRALVLPLVTLMVPLKPGAAISALPISLCMPALIDLQT